MPEQFESNDLSQATAASADPGPGDAATSPTSERPSFGRIGGLIVCAGGAVLAAAAWLGFAQVPGFDEPEVIDAFAESDPSELGGVFANTWLLDVPPGRVMLGAGVAIVALGIALAVARSRRLAVALAVTAAVVAPAVAAFLHADLRHLTDHLNTVAPVLAQATEQIGLATPLPSSVEVTPGRGLWAAFLGLGLVLLGALWTLAQCYRTRPQQTSEGVLDRA